MNALVKHYPDGLVPFDFIADIRGDEFREIIGQHTPDVTGWATPRKRPRRVHRKVAARDFAAHYGGRVSFFSAELAEMGVRPGRRTYQQLVEIGVHQSTGLIDALLRRKWAKSRSPQEPALIFEAPEYRFDGTAWAKADTWMVEAMPTCQERRYPRLEPRIMTRMELERVQPTPLAEVVYWTKNMWKLQVPVLHTYIGVMVVIHTPGSVDDVPKLARPLRVHIERQARLLSAAIEHAIKGGTFVKRVVASHTAYRPRKR